MNVLYCITCGKRIELDNLPADRELPDDVCGQACANTALAIRRRRAELADERTMVRIWISEEESLERQYGADLMTANR